MKVIINLKASSIGEWVERWINLADLSVANGMRTDVMAKGQVDSLRQNIDQCDRELVELLVRRQRCVNQLVAYKKAARDALYVPERETVILNKVTQLAEKQSLNPGLVRDIMQRIMRDSYEQQAKMEYACASETAKTICVVGGQGQLGSLFVEQFRRSGHTVSVLDKEDWHRSKVLLNVDLVLVAVPIHFTEQVIKRLNQLPSHTLLADITSIKSQPLQTMLSQHKGPVIGLHPMFGPGLSHFARQLMLVCPGRDPDACKWLLDQFRLWGCIIQSVDSVQHDQVMSLVQALRHFVTFVAGWHLMEQNVDLEQVVDMSSPIYRMELALIGRLFAQDPALYVDILLNASHGLQTLDQFGDIYTKAIDWLRCGDRDALIAQFRQVAEFLGSKRTEFFNQSETLLEAFRERS